MMNGGGGRVHGQAVADHSPVVAVAVATAVFTANESPNASLVVSPLFQCYRTCTLTAAERGFGRDVIMAVIRDPCVMTDSIVEAPSALLK